MQWMRLYHGPKKNMHRFNLLFASANLIMCSRRAEPGNFIKSVWLIVRPFEEKHQDMEAEILPISSKNLTNWDNAKNNIY